MNIDEYANIISGCDKARAIVGEELGDQIFDTITGAVDGIETFCKQKYADFENLGSVSTVINVEDDELVCDIQIYYDGELQEEDSEFIKDFTNKIESTGWNSYDNR